MSAVIRPHILTGPIPPGLDDDGQPMSPWLNRTRRLERDCAEMLGLAKGVLADGTITVAEADLVRDWAGQHPDAMGQWPINALKARLDRAFADGRIDEAEREDLSALLAAIVGGTAGMVGGEGATTALPLDQPQPALAWTGSVFVFTGKFAFGPREACQEQVVRRGAICEDNVTRRCRYLVLGTFGSRDWVQTPFGRKIEKAVKYREAGQPLAIVSEDHWAESLG